MSFSFFKVSFFLSLSHIHTCTTECRLLNHTEKGLVPVLPLTTEETKESYWAFLYLSFFLWKSQDNKPHRIIVRTCCDLISIKHFKLDIVIGNISSAKLAHSERWLIHVLQIKLQKIFQVQSICSYMSEIVQDSPAWASVFQVLGLSSLALCVT